MSSEVSWEDMHGRIQDHGTDK